MIEATVSRPNTARHFEADNDTYHGMGGWSNSRLSDFIDDPYLAYGRYVADPVIFPREEPTPDMEFGTNCHNVMQAGSLDSVFTVIPREALNEQGHRKGSAWKQFCEENAGKTLVKAEEITAYNHILANVKAHDKAARILYGNDGHTEFNIGWTDPETGIDLRCRIDRAVPGLLLADIKTTAAIDPRRFSQTVFAWGYHRQAALYQWGWEELTRGDGEFGEVLPFAFIAVRKTPPYSVAVYELDDAYIAMGQRELRRALADLRCCLDSGEWRRPDEVAVLSAPNFAKFESQWSLSQ